MSVQSQDLSKIIFRQAQASLIMYNYHNTQRHIIIPTLLSTRTVIITGAHEFTAALKHCTAVMSENSFYCAKNIRSCPEAMLQGRRNHRCREG